MNSRRGFIRSLVALLGGLVGVASSLAATPQTSSRSLPSPRTLECPWCDKIGTHSPLRTHEDATEYRCQQCGKTHTRKLGKYGVFAFFPTDIERAFHGGESVPVIPLPRRFV
jgi:hypothetical protein